MSQDEKDLQFMRVSRAVRTSRETIAELEAKISLYFGDVSAASRATGQAPISIGPFMYPDAVIAALRELPSIESIIESLAELKSERAALAESERMLASIRPHI